MNSISEEVLFFRGSAEGPRRGLEELPQPVQRAIEKTGHYEPSQALIRAANVALMLRMPLLLTGEPGTGKTQFARALSDEVLGGELIEIVVSSDATKRDILYSFDELGRLRDAYAEREEGIHDDSDNQQKSVRREGTRASVPLSAYITFRGLGRAILLAGGAKAKLEPLELRGKGTRFGTLPQSFDDLTDERLPEQGKQTILLIDEIDKASRDVPNDLLVEIEKMQFDIPELGVRARLPDGSPWPIIVITSNSERPLPEPFLRRCVFHHIELGTAEVRNILKTRVDLVNKSDVFLDQALALISKLRADESGITKKPGAAEILAWFRLILDPDRYGSRTVPSSIEMIPSDILDASLGVLVKSGDDMRRAKEILGTKPWSSPVA